jgi:hypothetical protein
MADPEIVLEWWRDALGYRIEEAIPPAPRGNMLEALRSGWTGSFPPWYDVMLPERILRSIDPGKPQQIRRQGGTLVPYQATDALDFIFREFVNTPCTDQGALSFVTRFGLLSCGGPDRQHGPVDAEPVADIIHNIQLMNEVIDGLSVDGSLDRAALAQTLGADGIRLAALKARLTVDEVSGLPKVTFAPVSLMAALWLHFGQTLQNDSVVLRRCLQCNVLFDAGVGTGRRKDSKFCSDAHRALFNNRRLSERRTEALDLDKARARRRSGRPA